MPPSRRRPNELRIIGGEWRGRRLSFPALPGLRPTPDRVRETLFNWLSPVVQGARCVDLFAGSGALGLEALSRGAAGVTFVDSQPEVIRQLRDSLQRLEAATRGEGVHAEAARWLDSATGPYRIAFVDPPFAAGLGASTLAALASAGVLARDGWVYVEQAAGQPPPAAPAGWSLHRQGRAGGVGYYLFRTGEAL
ncbi:MAG: 16S rRNA (guanine(966)-N(2))-methyltransferase RsmD [Steroidobacteraceae bacterium]